MMIVDIAVTDTFVADWEKVPQSIRRRVDKYINQTLLHGALPNSLNAHRVSTSGDLWIGYINVNHNPYRLLFRIGNNGRLIWERLVRHSEMDELLRNSGFGS